MIDLQYAYLMDNLLDELNRWRADLQHQIDNYWAVDKIELKKLKHHLSLIDSMIVFINLPKE